MSVCWVQGYGFDSDEEFAWSWFWGGSGLELKGVAFGWGDGGEVGRHFVLDLNFVEKVVSV